MEFNVETANGSLASRRLSLDFMECIEKCDEESMWKFLERQGADNEVFSARLNVVNAEIYLYCRGLDCVLMMIDGNNESCRVNTEILGKDIALYESEYGYRFSPVSFLLSVAKDLKALNIDCRIACVMLTNSTITNYDDMGKVWNTMGVTVRHNIDAIRQPLPTNQTADAPFPIEEFSRFVSEAKIYHLGFDNDDEDSDDDFGTDDYDLFDDDMEEDTADEAPTDEAPTENKPADAASTENKATEKPVADDPFAPKSSESDMERPPVRVLEYEKDSQKKLDDMVGLADIKRHIKDMVNLSQYNLKRWELHPELKAHSVNLHSIFSGPVGVGKTTVAQLFSSLLCDANVLTKGHVVICDRSTFIGKLWGDEERRVNQVVEMARGGVLFIDEAYTLVSNSPQDPGRLILPMMLNILADESQRDIAVVLAGYEKPMENLLSLNPGLASRFANRFHFKPFSVDELMEITTRKNAPYGYTFTEEASRAYRKLVQDAFMTKGSSFSNGRFVANLLEKTYIRHASRCMTNSIFDEGMMTITLADIPDEYRIETPRARMGFR